MLDKEIILIGYSGHGVVVAEAAKASNLNLKYYSELKKVDINPFNLKYIGFEKEVPFKGWEGDFEFILGIGDNKLREQISKFILFKNKKILNVIHHSASVSDGTIIGLGNFIARNVSINPLVEIKDFCIFNTSCVIEHECKIGVAVHIGPGAVLAGNVKVGDRVFIGANSVIKQGVTIESDVIIGAGSVILKDISRGKKVVGNPSREI